MSNILTVDDSTGGGTALPATAPTIMWGGRANPFEAYACDASSRDWVGELMKFSKGDFIAGRNGDVLPLGTQLVPIMSTARIGWQKWLENRLFGRRMGYIAGGFQIPERETLGDHDKAQWELNGDGTPKDPWQLTSVLVFVSAESPE